jgi:hypothetical protein
MGGVDTSDMMLYTYLDERRTLKYWKKVIFCVFARIPVVQRKYEQQKDDMSAIYFKYN